MDHYDHQDNSDDDFEIINPKNTSNAPIIETSIRSERYADGHVHVDSGFPVAPQPSLNMQMNDNSLKIEKEKKYVYIEVDIEMSRRKNQQVEHTDAVHIRNLINDEIVSKAISNITKMQTGVTAEGKAVMGGDVLNNPGMVFSGKKIKITRQMIEDAYQKLLIVTRRKKVDAKSIVIVAAYALQISNEMLITSKTYKVELALAIIRKLIDDDVDDLDQRTVLHMLVESTVPRLINTIQGLPSMPSRLFTKCCFSE
jgi:hypothetical protein